MNMRTRTLLPAVACLLLAVPVAAQTPFALTNIGQRLQNQDARMAGRGGWGMAVDDSLHPGFLNLSSLSSLRHVALQFTALGDHAVSQDVHGERTTYRTYAPDMRVGVPVVAGRLAVTAGFLVDRSFEYTTAVDTFWTLWDDTLTGQNQFVREGSMFKVPLGVAFAPVPGVSVSAAVNLQRGTLRESLYDLVKEPTTVSGVPLYGTNLLVQQDEYQGTSITLAGALHPGVGPGAGLGLGLSYTPAYDVTVDRKYEMGGVSRRGHDTFTLGMPAELRAGLQAPIHGRWRLGADYQLQRFTRFTGPQEWVDRMRDETTLSAGIERTAAHQRRAGWSNLPLRCGVQTRTWAYDVGGQAVKETTFSVGTGFPFRQDLGQLDVALSYSLVGDLADNGMDSRIWRLALSVSGLEKWW